MQNFSSFKLHDHILKNLKKHNFIKPTPIQVKTIPQAINGKDILGSANTGTGKTAAFAIPLVQKLILKKESSALVLTPTRELAIQVLKSIRDIMGQEININSALVIGGESLSKQFNQLNKNPRLIVGTPGRINDLLNRKILKLDSTNYFVLDETDRMLDMGFKTQIEKIIRFLPKVRQTLLFSATLPENINMISKKYLKKPVTISVDSNFKILSKIKHDIIKTTKNEKYNKLLDELNKRAGSIIVFTKTKYSTKKISIKLNRDGQSANAIHGDLKQNQRETVLKQFKKQKCRILVATDIASRGLDIFHVRHVISYDLPQRPEDYIHRIGRTARAGLSGKALCFLIKNDEKLWIEIKKIINPQSGSLKQVPKFKFKKKN